MTRRRQTETEAAGNDSFLDITTNIVGILIILVMVVGERAKLAPVELPPAPPSAALMAARSEAVQLENDVHRIADQMAIVQAELKARMAERGELGVLIAAIEQDLDEQRAALDETAQARYATQRDLALARDELARLEADRRQAEQDAATETIEIENLPTPIGKVVDSDEAHFQLLRGRLAFIPYESLMNHLRRSLRDSINRMQNQNEFVDMLGPIEGFRLRYVVQRHDVAGGSLFQLAYVEFMPVSSRLGEPVEAALRPGSELHHTLQMLSPHRYTITVWTYPDSFADFRKLKKELYAMGYAVAARPLPEGMPIGASPHGTKSSAE